MSEPRVKVLRLPMETAHGRWVVTCGFCAGGGPNDSFMSGLMSAAFGGPGRLGVAMTWRIAQDYAAAHGRAHVATRCPTCWNIPARPLADAAATRADQ